MHNYEISSNYARNYATIQRRNVQSLLDTIATIMDCHNNMILRDLKADKLT